MYCPIARALDVLGERWTLLILRELAGGDQRFTDLKRLVVGIPPNVLSNRLKALVDEGVVETRELPPPAARTVYGLTGRGREAMPVLRALARWGHRRRAGWTTAGRDWGFVAFVRGAESCHAFQHCV